MIFKIITIGKVRNKDILSQINILKKRINRLEIIELKEQKANREEEIKQKEEKLILTHLKSSYKNILLIEDGKQHSTKSLYQELKKQEKPLCFIITGAFGPSETLRNAISTHISLSNLTFTHEMAQLLLIEQLYRMQCYEKNIPYTK